MFNLNNPNHLLWDALIETLLEYRGMKAKPVLRTEWVKKLRKCTIYTPAVTLLSFFEAICGGQVSYREQYSGEHDLSANATSE